jgi:Fe-S-cluster containining protein
LFDLTLIEALYLNYHFNQKYIGKQKEQLIEKANSADRQTYKIKKTAYKLKQKNNDDETAIKEVSSKRIRCPLLDDEDMCKLYDYRPIACRVYGIPQAIGGKGHVCGFSGFSPGESYPTFNHDTVHDQLLSMSADFVKAIASKHYKMADMLVPVSMALITDYDGTYLGINCEEKTEEKELNGE